MKLQDDLELQGWEKVHVKPVLTKCQIINIFRGEMSLVGPRAYVEPEIKDAIKDMAKPGNNYQESLEVKPGLTGPWQVSGKK